VKVVVLSIDSGGGAPVEAERIGFMIDTLRKKHGKPVYAVIQNIGASAAYMIAMNTDKIYAGRYSLVGSIGAVMSSWDLHRAINKLEVEQKVFASGELKAMLNPFVAPTKGAERKAQELVDKAGAIFQSQLMERRKSKLITGINYGSGEIWDGDQAVKIGLIDELGTIESIALAHDAVIREYGPTQRTYSPFSALASETVQAMASAWATGAINAANQSGNPTLR
jgi:protease IV